MATRHRTFTFSSGDTAGILAEMAEFARDADGKRWLNIVPDADEREVHTGSIFWRMFSSRGPVIPQLTWLPSHQTRQGLEPHQVGIAHATGRDALVRLGDAGVHPPDDWRAVQDHQKRGIIFGVHPDAPLEEIVEFAMGALRELSPFGFEDSFYATFSEQ